MQIVHVHSHLGGAEILQVNFPQIDVLIEQAVAATGSDFLSKVSQETGREGRLQFSPGERNKAFKEEFAQRGFKELKRKVEPDVPGWDTSEMGIGFKQIDFFRDRVLVEVQFGKIFCHVLRHGEA